MARTARGELFEAGEGAGTDGTVLINERCRLRTQAGYHVVTVSGLTLAHYPAGDRMGAGYAMVSLVEQGWAKQTEVAAALANPGPLGRPDSGLPRALG